MTIHSAPNAPVWLSGDERRAVQQFAAANGWGVIATLRHAVRVAYLGGASSTLTVPATTSEPVTPATSAPATDAGAPIMPPVSDGALCELCHAREAVWYIIPLDGGQGVNCCAVCHTRQPADVLDLWRKRNAVQEVGE